MYLKYISNLKNLSFSFVIGWAVPSLMLTPDEQSLLVPKNQEIVMERSRCITLQGMLYQNPESWSIWIEGEKLTSKNRKSKTHGFEVHAISNGHIELQIEDEIKSFSIHDSFNPMTGVSCK